MSEGAKDWWAAPLRFSKYDLQSLSLTLISLNQTKLQSELFKHKLKEGWQEKRNSQGGRERLCCWWWRRGLLVSGQWTTISWLGMTTAGTPQHNFYQHNLTQPTQSQCHSIPYQFEWFCKDNRFLPQDNRNNANDNSHLWHQISCLYNSPMSGVQLTLICHENRQGCNKLLNYICVEKHYC